MTMPIPAYGPLADHFAVDRSVVFLNHGSFGSTPLEVMSAQHEMWRRVDADPVKFFVEDLEGMLDDARRRLATFVGAPADDLAFVSNATEGVNTVLASLDLRPGDELLCGSHEYNACANALARWAQRWGARVVSVELPCPVVDPVEIEQAVLGAITPRTRLLLLSHITSPSGLVMPVASIIAGAQGMGVDVLLDGAHAPGYLPLNIQRLAPAYCTANLHKWCCAPKGAAVLYVRPDRQSGVRPLVISHGANSPRTDRTRFRLEFDMTGSRDYSPWLCAPLAMDLVGGLCGGWEQLRAQCADLARRGGAMIAGALAARGEGRLLGPESMLGMMRAYTLPTPKGSTEPGRGIGSTLYSDPLQERLLRRWRVQVPVHSVALPGGGRQRVIRLSAMVYNALEQYEYLACAMDRELREEGV